MTPPRLTILERIAAVGVERIRWQALAPALTAARATKHGTLVTFATAETTPGQLLNDEGPVGVILWLDRAALEAIENGETS